MASVRIGTVAAHCPPTRDTAAVRRLQRLLEQLDVIPSGMAPQSILIVRSVKPSVSLSLATRRAGQEWERGVRDAVAGCRRRASRPERGRIPHDAEAVLFLDEAEMLACLARDLRRGEAWGRWWWRNIVRYTPTVPLSSVLTTHFCSYAHAVPGALGHLAAWGCAGEIIEALTPAHAQEVFGAVCAAYGLTVPSGRGVTAPEAAPGRRRHQAAANETLPAGRPGQHARSVILPPPWEAWIPHQAVPVGMTLERACLLGVGLALLRAPSLARSQEFAAALAEWRAAREVPGDTDAPRSDPVNGEEAVASSSRSADDPVALQPPALEIVSPPDEKGAPASDAASDPLRPASANPANTLEESAQHATATEPAGSLSRVNGEDAAPETAEPAQAGAVLELPEPAPGPAQPETAKPEPAGAALETTEPAHSPAILVTARAEVGMATPVVPTGQARITLADSVSATVRSEVEAIEPRSQVGLSHQATAKRDARGGSADIVDKTGLEIAGLTPAALADGVVTRLGGVLYLINLMRHFDLPGGFEEEWQLAGRVGAWGVLEALTRGLLASDNVAMEADPIWKALALLDGRDPGRRLGAALPASSRFHLPPAWLDDIPGDLQRPPVVHWAAGRRTLRLWCADGYLLAETPRNGLDEELQARAELSAYPALAARAELVRSPLRATPIRLPRAPLPALAPALVCWLGRALPFLRRRLLQALNAAREEADPVMLLLRAPGRLHMTATHVDLVLPLDAISIPARMAGLDRDPGWMPDFGRVILFHFQ